MGLHCLLCEDILTTVALNNSLNLLFIGFRRNTQNNTQIMSTFAIGVSVHRNQTALLHVTRKRITQTSDDEQIETEKQLKKLRTRT